MAKPGLSSQIRYLRNILETIREWEIERNDYVRNGDFAKEYVGRYDRAIRRAKRIVEFHGAKIPTDWNAWYKAGRPTGKSMSNDSPQSKIIDQNKIGKFNVRLHENLDGSGFFLILANNETRLQSLDYDKDEHKEAERDYNLFCQIVSDVLSCIKQDLS